MASFNLCTFIGRVGIEPEQHTSQDGTAVTRFRLAVDAPNKDKDTQWLTIISFKKLAETVATHVKKGTSVLVSGRLSLRSYTDKHDLEKTAVEILANEVVFLSPKAKEQEAQEAN